MLQCLNAAEKEEVWQMKDLIVDISRVAKLHESEKITFNNQNLL